MLSPHDADLVRRDPDLPGLALMLDPDVFISRLHTLLPDYEPGTAQRTYIRYKPGTSCRILYRFELSGEVRYVYAIAGRLDAQDKLQKSTKQYCPQGQFGPGSIIIEECAMKISFFPNDNKLKVLPCLFDMATLKHLLCKLIPDRPDIWEGTVQTLVYKPERRYVAKLLTDEGAQVVLKFYTKDDYHTVNTGTKAFRSHGQLSIPRRIGRSNRHHIIAFQWLPGRLASEAMYNDELECKEVESIGAAIAELHSQNPAGLAYLKTETAYLHELAAWITYICPNLAGRIRDLAQRIAAGILQKPPVYRPIHGDFYAKQVLIKDGSAAILDLDRAVYGDPAADLGNFIAHLERDALRNNIPHNRVEQHKGALLKGYGAATNLPTGIELYTAAGLFKLAPDPFRYCEPNWPERTEAILERAHTILKTIPEQPTRNISTANCRLLGRYEY